MSESTVEPPGLRDIDHCYTVLPNGCWRFDLSCFPTGYGQIRRGGKARRAHRYFYERLVGPIPEGHDLDHTCHNNDRSCPGGYTCPHRRCVNPDHLEPVTNAENKKRAHTGRCRQGHPMTPENRKDDKQCRICVNALARQRYAQRKAIFGY